MDSPTNHQTNQSRLDESAAASTERKKWLHRTLYVIGGLFVFRLLYVALMPLDLVHDEAYYWDWSRQLDWGYYSKPPMIAWLIAFSTSLGGSSNFFVRLPAVILGTGVLIPIGLLAARMYGPKAGFRAVIVSAAMPGNAAMSLIMTIDAPFVFFWCVSLYATWRWLQADKNRIRWVLLATLATGIGVLSKQTMLGFLPLLGMYLLLFKQHRRELVRPAFWCWALGSILFLTPVVLWNAGNGWITVAHTSSHFDGETTTVTQQLLQSLEFIVTQVGVVSPVAFTLYVIVGIAGLISLRTLRDQERYLICFSIIPLLAVVGLSLLRQVEPNWPASFYPAGIVLVVGWAVGNVRIPTLLKPDEKYLKRSVIVGGALVLITYLLPLGFGLQGTRFDPVVRLRGWSELGRQTETPWAAAAADQKTFLMVVGDRSVAAELAFYMPSQPHVYMWSGEAHPISQYDLWGGPKDKEGWNAIVVTHIGDNPPASFTDAFESLEPIDDVQVRISANRKHHIQLWRGIGYRKWPEGTAATATRTIAEASETTGKSIR